MMGMSDFANGLFTTNDAHIECSLNEFSSIMDDFDTQHMVINNDEFVSIEDLPYFDNVEQTQKEFSSQFQSPPFVIQIRKHDENEWSLHCLYRKDDIHASGFSMLLESSEIDMPDDRDDCDSMDMSKWLSDVIDEHGSDWTAREDMPMAWMSDGHTILCEWSKNIVDGKIDVDDEISSINPSEWIGSEFTQSQEKNNINEKLLDDIAEHPLRLNE